MLFFFLEHIAFHFSRFNSLSPFRYQFESHFLQSERELFCSFIYFFKFYGHTRNIWKFPGQGLNLSHSCELCHSCRHARYTAPVGGIKSVPLQWPRLLQSNSQPTVPQGLLLFLLDPFSSIFWLAVTICDIVNSYYKVISNSKKFKSHKIWHFGGV